MVCKTLADIEKQLHVLCEFDEIKSSQMFYFLLSVTAVSALFLSATIFVYGCVRELRTDHGKSLLFFLVGLLITNLCLPVVRFEDSELLSASMHDAAYLLLTTGFQFTFTWMSILSFDIWWTMR